MKLRLLDLYRGYRSRNRLDLPKLRLSDLYRWDGAIDRGSYAFWGLLLFAIKHNVDRLVASCCFDRPWSVLNYWFSDSAVLPESWSPEDMRFFGTLMLIALPFIWAGIILTVRRLRGAGIPLGYAAVFFAPFVNLVFFALLCVLPSRIGEAQIPGGRYSPALVGGVSRWIPDGKWGNAVVAVFLTALVGAPFVWFGTSVPK